MSEQRAEIGLIVPGGIAERFADRVAELVEKAGARASADLELKRVRE